MKCRELNKTYWVLEDAKRPGFYIRRWNLNSVYDDVSRQWKSIGVKFFWTDHLYNAQGFNDIKGVKRQYKTMLKYAPTEIHALTFKEIQIVPQTLSTENPWELMSRRERANIVKNIAPTDIVRMRKDGLLA